jgi:protein transport protein SEC61 subunit gamma-like protein
MAMQETWLKLKSFLIQTQHVLKVTRKPTRDEFKTIVKITGLGIAVIGAIGFILQMGKQLIFR